MSGYNSRINLLNQGDTVSVSPAFTPNHAPRVRIGGTGFKIWEPAKPQGTGKAKANPGLNNRVIGDFIRLIAGRRGLGPWSLAIAEAIFDEAAPRIIARAVRGETAADAALLKWSQKHLPELVEAKGTDWVEERCEEIQDEKHGSFRTMDQIAKLLTITQDEVLGFTLYSLVAHDRPKAVRTRENKARNTERHAEVRAKAGATPRHLSLAARHKRGEFGTMNLKTVRRQIKAGKISDPNAVSNVHFSSDVPEASNVHFSSNVHISSDTVRSTCKVSDEKWTPDLSNDNSISVEGDQPEGEPLAIAPEDTTHTVEIDIGDRIVTIQVPMPTRNREIYSEDRIRGQIQRLQAVAHLAQADFAREVPFGASGSWF